MCHKYLRQVIDAFYVTFLKWQIPFLIEHLKDTAEVHFLNVNLGLSCFVIDFDIPCSSDIQ